MILKFIRPHLSIGQFNDVEVDRFSLLTGLNGAGKTHLLQAIKSGAIEVENLTANEIIYFNYSDFVVNTLDSKKREIAENNKNSLLNTYQEKIGTAVTQFTSDSLSTALVLNARNFGISFFDGSASSRKFFDDFIKAGSSSYQKASLLGNPIYGHLSSLYETYIYHEADMDLFTYDKIKEKLDFLDSQIRQGLENSREDYYTFLAKSIPKEKRILALNQTDFENMNLFDVEIADEIKKYDYRRFENAVNEVSYQQGDRDVTFLNEHEFLQKFGKSPLDQMNEVLNEYDCNGYLLQGRYRPKIGDNVNQIKVPINLFHKTKGYATSLSALSSGEQTLLAIALMVYKARKGNVLPRLLLLDEIDSALHPSMIRRLLHVLNTVFVKDKGISIVMVTHSPTTVALFPSDSVYVVSKDSDTLITSRPKEEAIEFLTEGFATLEKGLRLFDEISKKTISIITEGYNAAYLRKANLFFGNDEIDIIEGIEDITGKNQLDSYFKLFAKVPHSKKVVFVWDCDAPRNAQPDGNTYRYVFTKNNDNSEIQAGIENLFSKELFTSEYYTKQPKDKYGCTPETFNKNLFKNTIIANGTKEDFKNFEPFFNWLKTL